MQFPRFGAAHLRAASGDSERTLKFLHKVAAHSPKDEDHILHNGEEEDSAFGRSEMPKETFRSGRPDSSEPQSQQTEMMKVKHTIKYQSICSLRFHLD